jgi:hypothetical protein
MTYERVCFYEAGGAGKKTFEKVSRLSIMIKDKDCY